ncbi:phosphoglycerate kinase [Pseudomonadota bacterium]|nr:phosphoglycerate kinase [Pseudomonadota bacterium]
MRTLKDIDLRNKRAVLRLDLNVPIQDNKISDDSRIIASLPTIHRVLKDAKNLLIISHLGRPEEGVIQKEFSMKPIADYLERVIDEKITIVDYLDSTGLFRASKVQILENIRFFKGEKENCEQLGKSLGELGDVYIFDAFGTAHRKQASTYSAIKHASQSCAGLLMEKEITMLSEILNEINHPFTAIIGGAKISTKINLISNLANKASCIVVGGGIANTFLKAAGFEIGESLFEKDFIQVAEKLLETGKIHLPNQVYVGSHINTDKSIIKDLDELEPTDRIFDLKLNNKIISNLKESKTILWNGPLGVFENKVFEQGTQELAKIISNSKAFSVAGGGETLAAINKFISKDELSYCSSGGGSFLEFMEGKTLPSVEALGG